MQTSIYYTKKDQWLLDKIGNKAQLERRSKSAVILNILEQYFTRKRKIGEILQDMGYVSQKQLTKGLKIQKQQRGNQLLGEILLSHSIIREKDLQRALALQGNSNLN